MQIRCLKDVKLWFLRKLNAGSLNNISALSQLLTSCVELTVNDKGKELFLVKLRGSIRASYSLPRTVVQIFLTDITEGIEQPRFVADSARQRQGGNGSLPVFCYTGELGRLPSAVTVLSDWTTVASINSESIVLPRSGSRLLQFTISVLSAENSQRIAAACCNFNYENRQDGYLDVNENIERAKVLTVTLAFAVSAADKNMPDCEVELIRNWARSNVNAFDKSDRAKKQLEKALNRTVRLLQDGSQIDIAKVCDEIVRIAPPGMCSDILELCFYVAKAKGAVCRHELEFLKDLSLRLDIDSEQFQIMTEKILPPRLYQEKDSKFILGLNSDMTTEQTRKHLNELYRRWSARVTNFNPEIRTQAEDMLNFIAQARNEYVH